MKRLLLILFVLALPLSQFVAAQAFANGSLNGTIGISNTPTSWLQVPYLDPVSQSTMPLAATSDVTGTTGPMAGVINGNPYQGTTLVSGLHMTNGADTWHEGIEQTVTGLAIGTAYTISFFQNVIKQSNATDQVGSWAVYKENNLIAISTPTNDPAPYGTNGHIWQRRTVVFTATAASHLIKFLPRDDDANIISPEGLRMGIDSITLRVATILPASVDFQLSLIGEENVAVDWEIENVAGIRSFQVEHSPDGIHFEEIGGLDAAEPGLHFLDVKPFIECYYRIAIIQEDGGISYSEVKQILTQAPIVIDLFGRNMKIHGGYGGEYELSILSMSGQPVLVVKVAGDADLSLLSSGIYFLRIVSKGEENAILEKKVFLD